MPEEMQNSTEESVSLHDDIGSIYDEMEKGETVEEPEQDETPEEDVEDDTEEAEEGEEGVEDDETEDNEEDDESETDTLDAPEHWAGDHKQVFNGLSELGEPGRKAQEFLLERHREMERAANEKMQQAAAGRKRGEQFDEIVAPYKRAWSAHGVDEATAVKSILTQYQALQENPAQMLRHLAQQFQVDLTESQSDDDFTDPAVKQLRQELHEMKQQREREAQQQQQSAQAKTVSEIQAFEQATDEAGNAKHPHFQTVYSDMVGLIKAGLASDLDTAYQKAVNLHPELIADSQRKSQEDAEKKAKADKAKKARRAKAAASGVKSRVASSVETGKAASLRDEISAIYDEYERGE